MTKKLVKNILYLLVLIISPLILAAIVSAIFVAIHLMNGERFFYGNAGSHEYLTLKNPANGD